MPTNLSGSNISDTFQQVLHTTGDGNMYDGTGSIFIPLSASHEITTELSSSHAEVADALTPGVDINVRSITASSAISSSFLGAHQLGPVKIQNGGITLDTNGVPYPLSATDGILSVGHPSATFSTKFLNHITASGDISSSRIITADKFVGVGIESEFGQVNTSTINNPEGITLQGNVTASGDISASDNIYGKRLYVENIPLAKSGDDTISLGTNNLILNAITASSGISASHNIYGKSFFANDQSAVVYHPTDHFRFGYVEEVKIGIGKGENLISLKGTVTASGDISASGNIFTSGSIGVGTNSPDEALHIYGPTPRLKIEAQANGTPKLQFKNNQSPDFAIKNVFSDGGLQIASEGGPAKSFVTIGANDGDVIELSGSVDVTGTNGTVTASSATLASHLHIGNSGVPINERLIHLSNSGSSTYLRLSTTANHNQVIEFHNDQEPDFQIGNYHTDGGFQIRSDNKKFLIIGADDGDKIFASGSLEVSGDISGSLTSTGSFQEIRTNFIRDIDDPTTGIDFTFGDQVHHYVNSVSYIRLRDSVQDVVRINEGMADIDLEVRGDNHLLLRTDATENYVEASGSLLVSGHGNITASGDISASGTLIGNAVYIGGDGNGRIIENSDNIIIKNQVNDKQISIGGVGGSSNLTAATFDFSDKSITVSDNFNITASGNISASGTVFADKFRANQFGADTSTNNYIMFNSATHTTQLVNGGTTSAEFDNGYIEFNRNITGSGQISMSGTGDHTLGGNLTVHGRIRSVGSDVTIENGTITLSGNISGSLTSTGSFAHIVTEGDTIEFRNAGSKIGQLKVDDGTGFSFDTSDGSDRKPVRMGNISAKEALLAGSLTASADVSASSLKTEDLFVMNNKYLDYHTGTNTFRVSGNDGIPITFFANITASGADISASGHVYGDRGIFASRIQTPSWRNTDISITSDNGPVNFEGSGGTTLTINSQTGEITASGNISSSGRLDVGSIITADGDVIAFSDGGDRIRYAFQNNTPIFFGKSLNPAYFYGAITASTHVSASGRVIANQVYLDSNDNGIAFLRSGSTANNDGSIGAIGGTGISIQPGFTAAVSTGLMITSSIHPGESSDGRHGIHTRVSIGKGFTSGSRLNFSVSGSSMIGKRDMDYLNHTQVGMSAQGDIIRHVSNVQTVPGAIYTFLSNGNIGLADKDNVSSTGSLFMAIGPGGSQMDGLLMRGVIKTHTTYDQHYGGPLWLGDNGSASVAPPSDSSDIARIIGYVMSGSTIYFNPDNSFVKRS